MTSAELFGGSRWQRALYRHLTSRADDKAELLDRYQRAADESHSAAFGYLVSLIAEDERRHLGLLAELAATLVTEVDRRPEPFAVPRLGHWGFERTGIAELSETFLAQERTGLAGLADLEAELDPVKDATMWALLVRLMKADSAKHIEILEFVKAQAGRPFDAAEADWAGTEKVTAPAGSPAPPRATSPTGGHHRLICGSRNRKYVSRDRWPR